LGYFLALEHAIWPSYGEPKPECPGFPLLFRFIEYSLTVDVKNAQATEETHGSDMVAKGMMEVHTAHATSTPIMETSKALK